MRKPFVPFELPSAWDTPDRYLYRLTLTWHRQGIWGIRRARSQHRHRKAGRA